MVEALRRSRSDAIALGLLTLIPLLLFADIIFFGNTFFFRDLTYYYYPTKKILREIILSGQIPYWNHWYSGGQPLAANPDYQAFYPLQALILLPNFDFWYRVHVLIHIPIALAGMYCLLRSIRLGIAAAFFGALSFGLSGWLLSYVNLLPHLFTLTWLPWILLFFRRFLLRSTARRFAPAVGFLGLSLLAAEPITIVQTGLLMAGYALYRAWQDEKPGLFRRVAWRIGQTCLVIIVATSIAAVQLFPAIDLVRDTPRSAGEISYELAGTWSMPPIRVFELLAPRLLGDRSESGLFLWAQGVYDGRNPYLLSIYLGLFPAVLALAGLLHRRRGRAVLLAATTVGFVVALGHHTPLLRLLYASGVFSAMRYPEKFVLMAAVSLTVLSAITLDRIVSGDRVVLKSAIFIAAGITIAALALFGLTFLPEYGPRFVDFWEVPADAPAQLLLEISARSWAMLAVRASAVALLLLMLMRRESPPRAWYAAVLLFVLYDLGSHSNEVVERIPGSILSPPPIASALQPGRSHYRLLHETQIDFQRGRILPWAGNASYFFARNALLSRTPAAWGFRTVYDGDYDLTHLEPTRALTAALDQTRDRGFAETPEVYRAIANVGFVATLKPGAPFGYLHPVEHQVPITVDATRQYPRYYFADQMVLIRGFSDFVDKTIRRTWSSRVAFVEFPPFPPATGRVGRTVETANTTELEVECEGKAFLVISVTPHRYWKAMIDGRAEELVPANLGFQGLIIPPGSHTVRLEYRNPWVAAGGTLSFLSLLSVFGAALLRGRSPQTP